MGIVTQGLKPGTFTEALKERTWALHTAAERSGVINDILRKKVDRYGYALLLRNLLPAYRAMEQQLERLRDRQIFQVFARPELYRAERIASDLSALNGAHWEAELELLPAASAYAARITKAAEHDGARLISHAYVRYFGDLSGGQIMKKMLGAALNLDTMSLSFYDFPGIANPGDFKNRMRETIDTDVAANCDQEAVLVEAAVAFEHNIAISTAVQELLRQNQ